MTITDILKEKFIGKQITVVYYPGVVGISGIVEDIVEEFNIEETEWCFKLQESKQPILISRDSEIKIIIR